MEWLNELMGIGASVVSGGLFGMLGSIVGAVGKYFQEKQRQAFQVKEWAHEVMLLDKQSEARAVETEHELAIVMQEGSWGGLKESLQAARFAGATHKWVNDIRALFRPILTTGLIVVCVIFFFYILAAMRGQGSVIAQYFDTGALGELFRYLVYSLVFASTTAVVWWFGDRALTPPSQKSR